MKNDTLSNLTPIRKPAPYEKIVALDIETGSKGQLLDIGVVYDAGELKFETFPAWKDFFSLLFSSTAAGDVRIIAHNGFGFDYVGMIQYLLKNLKALNLRDEDLTFLSSEALVVALIIKQGERKITFIDTMRFFPSQSLNNVAKDFLGEEKDDVPDDFIHRMETYKAEHPRDYYAYLEKDCRLLYRVYEVFRDQINRIEEIGELGLSSGSTAMKCFRRSMARNDFFIFSAPRSHWGAANLAMRGGLTLYIGDGTEVKGEYRNVYHYDVISMYPSVMRHIPVPTSPMKTVQNVSIPKGRFTPGWYLVDFEQTRGRVPVLYSCETDDNDNRIHNDPVFAGQGILSHFDMEFLREYGKIRRIYEAILYDDFIYPFGDYIDAQLQSRIAAKRAGHKAESAALKVLLNSLYGKFAQAPQREQMAITSDFDWYEKRVQAELRARGSSVIEYFFSNDLVLYGVESQGTGFSNRFIGATVTSLARLKLGLLYNTVPTIYCDTDSLFTQQRLPDAFIGNEAGDFEHCDDSPARMICCGKKSYAYGDEIMWKGIPKRKLTRADVARIKKGDVLPVEYRRPTQLKTALKNDLASPNEFVTKTRRVTASPSLKKQGVLKESRRFFISQETANFLQYLFR